MHEKILKAWKSEKLNDQLQPLDPDFYVDLNQYIDSLNIKLRNPNLKTLNNSLTNKELQNMLRIMEDIIETRIEKLLRDIQLGTHLNTEHKNSEEFKIIQNLNEIIDIKKKFRNSSQKSTSIKEPKTLLRILQPLQKIVCIDTRTYGPFEVEDVVNLPKENAELLTSRGIAEKIDVPS